jgi:hypothetical protein
MKATNSSRIRKAIASLLLLSTTATFAAPGDYAGAGRAEGASDSIATARTMGQTNGRTEGQNRGYQDGFQQCGDQMRQQEQARGQRDGDIAGTRDGSDAGSRQASYDGQTRGAADGAIDGNNRSDRQANADATPPGTAAGISEANQTDAAARGAADGKIAGNASAKTDADANEYQPARDQYKNERYAEPIRSETTINMNGPASATTSSPSTVKRGFADMKTLSSSNLLMARLASFNTSQLNGPNDPPIPNVPPTQSGDKAISYCKANTSTANPTPPPAPGTVSEFQKCVEAYKPAYEQAFVATFRTEYVGAYTPAFNQQYNPARSQGCEAARRADYSRDYRDAYNRSHDESYRITYDRVYKTVYAQVYGNAFAQASTNAYRADYQGHYDAHYADAKAKAFAARQDELYTGAFESAKSREYSLRYPGYKAAAIARGRADEAADFLRVPVRLIGIAMKETVKDGIQEPGEKLTVDMDLRNFSESPIAARDLDIRAVAKTSGVAIPGSVTILSKDFGAKSLNHIVGALDIRLDESAIGRDAQVEIQISVRGQRLAAETIHLNARELTTVGLIETPVVRLGYPGTLRLRVTNQSQLPLPENATLALSTHMPGVVFTTTSLAVNGLNAGESRDLEFPFNAESYADGQEVDFVGSLNVASGRRIGILNESREVPALQDYQFKVSNGILLGSIKDLRGSGTTRIKVYAKNISTRQSTQTLTLTASIAGPNASLFSFAKGNQTQFPPFSPGQEQESDKMVIKVDKDNSGGTFVVEVREGGRLIGSFKQDF